MFVAEDTIFVGMVAIPKNYVKSDLGGGFKYFLFSLYLRKIPILTNIFQMGWNHQPVLLSLMILGIHVKIPGCINCIYTPSQQKKPNVMQNTGDFLCIL